MDKKIGMYSSVVNFIAVVCFALSMLFGFDYGSYFSSMFIAFSFVPMMCGYAHFAEKEAKLAGYVSVAFSAIYDLLGYAVMSLATFFAGLAISVGTKTDKWLKYQLMVHGIFFISCLIMPMIGAFKANSPTWIGVVVLEFWCLYFCPISVLSYLHFSNCGE